MLCECGTGIFTVLACRALLRVVSRCFALFPFYFSFFLYQRDISGGGVLYEKREKEMKETAGEETIPNSCRSLVKDLLSLLFQTNPFLAVSIDQGKLWRMLTYLTMASPSARFWTRSLVLFSFFFPFLYISYPWYIHIYFSFVMRLIFTMFCTFRRKENDVQTRTFLNSHHKYEHVLVGTRLIIHNP